VLREFSAPIPSLSWHAHAGCWTECLNG
jgi:hypothetical protein